MDTADQGATTATEARLAQAASFLYVAVRKALEDERGGLHYETAIAAAAYIGGAAILQSCRLDLSKLAPGAPVFVDQVNAIGPAVVQRMLGLVDAGPQTAGAADVKASPAATVPPNHEPFLHDQEQFRLCWPSLESVAARTSLPVEHLPYACAAVAARLILEAQTQLPASIGKAIAIAAMVKGSKTVPWPVAQTTAITPEIRNETDFFLVLARTASEIRDFASREPAYPVWRELREQLDAMQTWTATNTRPTAEQQQRISIGLVAARELEPPPTAAMQDLITRLHLLNYFWRHWGAQPRVAPTSSAAAQWTPLRKAALISLLALAALVVAAVVVVASLQVKSPFGSPMGSSVRTASHVATLIQTLEPYTATLHRDPVQDRYRIALSLVRTSSGAAVAPRPLISIIGGLRASELRFGVSILGADGQRLWIYANGILLFDLETEQFRRAADLRRANPSLPTGIWDDDSQRFAFDGERLRVTTPDYQQTFEVDAASLQAVPAPPVQELTDAAIRNLRRVSAPNPIDYLCSGAFASPTEWFGVLSEDEAARDYKPGSWLSRENRAADSTDRMRRPYRAVVEARDDNASIVSISPLVAGEQMFRNAALVRSEVDSPLALRLSSPESFLMVNTSKPGLQGTLVISRIEPEGKILWTSDTGLDRFSLAQILPGATSIAFVGVRPRVPGKVPEPILVLADHQSGAISTISLWR